MYPYFAYTGTEVGNGFSPWDVLVFGNSTSGGSPHFHAGGITSSGFHYGGMTSSGFSPYDGWNSGGFLPYGGTWVGGGAPALYGGISSGGFVPTQGNWLLSTTGNGGWISGG
ncbi:hypothetical protein [Bacillus thuringiensis]|uniref:hypothetical protein n=1 Tax=Bacillus thuringiensis TaxID=1428 RepID=UPI000BFC4304|nr:hypothetical protein [Bacillus thuringiensis]PGP53331.1 hypothetical protein COA06_01035 [Bacillus thuringiensis]